VPIKVRSALRSILASQGIGDDAPCSAVDWIVLARAIEVDGADIERFTKLYPMNARSAQKIETGGSF
jgi:carbonic anhydrase